jgi:hypothetical protein
VQSNAALTVNVPCAFLRGNAVEGMSPVLKADLSASVEYARARIEELSCYIARAHHSGSLTDAKLHTSQTLPGLCTGENED